MHNNKPDFLSKHSAISARKRTSPCPHSVYLIWDSENYETEALSNSSSKYKGGFDDESEVSHL
jgi:hypothetical protein